ncbi:hypothetical protein FQV27_16705 [Paracoccus aurantiacus]|uniref:Uncharacterized protein n=1 Tax=Paracoccus aurantiacus TaxID=2599412 RepID=A0A5C6RTQ5_9RHOB|nr:hypothetical protein [Paracoccus aurantiacus]TXB65691.1 hypothetical protein FQV27_16705 [Paracoccus aurantiacus]
MGIALDLGITTAIAAIGAGRLTGATLLLHRTHLGLLAATAMLAIALILVLHLSLKTQTLPRRKLL